MTPPLWFAETGRNNDVVARFQKLLVFLAYAAILCRSSENINIIILSEKRQMQDRSSQPREIEADESPAKRVGELAVAARHGKTADVVADHPPVGEATYRRVRADIVYGRLAPGQKLTLERMRGAYGSAVSTLREIFNGLASEGLITAEGARGFEVASISPDNLREIAAMRQLLECDALRSSFEAGDVEWEGRVVAAHHKLATLEKRMASGDRSDEEILRRYDWEFHNALISACGSRVLLDMHAGIYDKYLRYLMLAAVFRGEPVADEHRKLLNFALERDWRSAKATTITHIQDCVAQMVSGDWWLR